MVPRFRADLDRIPIYDPGPPIDQIAASLGLPSIAEMASNECPEEPFPEVLDAISRAAGLVNRYPETNAHYLAEAIAAHHGVSQRSVWVAPGSTAVLTAAALAATGPGTSIVHAHPSFVVYGMAALLAGAEPIPVPLDDDLRIDPAAMAAAVREDTNLLYLCNPNNPTGTHTPAAGVAGLVADVPDRVTIVIDEAYAEYATAPDYAGAIPLALQTDNVVVTRTFSKAYGLAGLRVGYAIGDPGTLAALRTPQAPYSVTTLAQHGAIAALGCQERLASRISTTASGRDIITIGLRDNGQSAVDSQTNFVLWRPQGDPAPIAETMLREGIMVRPLGPWIRVTVGTEDENKRFVAALDRI